MKVLAISDQEVPRIYSLAASGQFKDVDMLIGCGDLPYTYLEYLVTVMHVPLYYVPGNHDPRYDPHSALTYAEGGTNLDMRVAFENGLLLAGLGGSVRYRPDGVNQYNQSQAYRRAIRLLLTVWFNRLRHGRGLDILITHSPPFEIHDDDTPAHQGLKALNLLIRTARPRYHLHGHTHFYRQNLADSVTYIDRTIVMNIFPYKLIEIADAQ
jgi:Icc-related predicted phosphoesterase